MHANFAGEILVGLFCFSFNQFKDSMKAIEETNLATQG
jgi:altronate dehydratase